MLSSYQKEAGVPKVTEEKKQVLVRLRLKTYEALLLQSTQETVKRGTPVSVPALITEKIERDLDAKKGASNG
jgi:hypothetical protein